MRPRTASCWALAASAVLVTVSGYDIPHKGVVGPLRRAVAESGGGEGGQQQRRGILDDIANLLDPSRNPRADDNNSESGGGGGGASHTDDNNPPPDSKTTKPSPSSSTTPSSTPTTPSSTSTTPDTTPSSSTTKASSSPSSSPRSNTSSHATSTPHTTDTTPTTPDPTSPPPSSSSSPKPTPSTDMVVVTVTRPNVTITTHVPPPPIIDQSDGDKADVGAPSNLTTVIVAPCVTAVALLLCAVMYYMYSKRRNRVKYGDEDIFAKGARRNTEGSPFSQNNASPFVPPEHSNSARADGYIKEENDAFYARPQPPRTTPSFNAHPMANPRYQQQAVPLVHPANPAVVPGTARYMPQPGPPPAQSRYGAMQSAPGYAPAAAERDSQFTETFAYEPSQPPNNGYNGVGQGHPSYHNGGGHR
ncbi:hypothetical protein GGI24_002070 [Coemansia furcata]|nr:hypothetical protein GGI24_002070 [Coemansia furcata]